LERVELDATTRAHLRDIGTWARRESAPVYRAPDRPPGAARIRTIRRMKIIYARLQRVPGVAELLGGVLGVARTARERTPR